MNQRDPSPDCGNPKPNLFYALSNSFLCVQNVYIILTFNNVISDNIETFF